MVGGYVQYDFYARVVKVHNKCITKIVQNMLCYTCRNYFDTGSLSKANNVEKYSQNRFIPFISWLFGLNSESKLSYPLHVFYSKNSSSF